VSPRAVPRVVSLVPSASETLLALGVVPVAVTRFCEQPGIPTVGGTKNPDVGAIVALHPDLVVVNDEENRLVDVTALTAAGVRVHDMSPRTVDAVPAAVDALAVAIGARLPHLSIGPPFAVGRERRRAFVPVWRRPWMTMNSDTYGASVLAHIGVDCLFADHPDRYPTVTIDAVVASAPDLVVLPTEPYAFTARHAHELRAAVPSARDIEIVDGRDLFWWGIRTPGALGRLRARVAAVTSR